MQDLEWGWHPIATVRQAAKKAKFIEAPLDPGLTGWGESTNVKLKKLTAIWLLDGVPDDTEYLCEYTAHVRWLTLGGMDPSVSE